MPYIELTNKEAIALLAIFDSFENSESGIKAKKASKLDRSHPYRDCVELIDVLEMQLIPQVNFDETEE